MNRDELALQTATPQANAGQDDRPAKAIRVEIYVTEHCRICEYAYEVAKVIRSDFPEIELRVIDLAQATEEIPEAVFATPTYLLNGRLWSLGNPSPEDVQERLSLALRRSETIKTPVKRGIRDEQRNHNQRTAG